MKASLELKAMVLAAVIGLMAVSLALAASRILLLEFKPAVTKSLEIPASDALANQGYKLYRMNCAHCHGNDAAGDEGPDLHGVAKSDGRIASLIKNGIKGEMPKFGAKLTDPDVDALIVFIRTLK